MASIFARVKEFFLADAIPGNTLPQLETSLDPRVTFNRLKNHKWTRGDLQYIPMAVVMLFCFIIDSDPPLFFRLSIALLLTIAVIIPATSQFWFPFLPIGTWLVLFYSCRFIPPAWRPSICVRLLPALETIFYGGNLSEVLASSKNSVLDVLAWLPYGLIHFGAPFVVSIICFLFGPPSMLRVWAFAFGWMNIIGVSIQILFPTAPPWYKIDHGLDPANYSMPGSAGGLARIDKLLGLNLYTGTFGASPQVFGAFPSLHSGCATIEVLFLSHMFPSLTPFFFLYEMWIWWSTMYLTHHYFIDLVGGAALSFTVFYACKMTCLPRMLPGKLSRWSYDYVEIGIAKLPAKLRKSIDDGEFIELPPLDTVRAAAVHDIADELEYHSPQLSSPVPHRPGLFNQGPGRRSPQSPRFASNGFSTISPTGASGASNHGPVSSNGGSLSGIAGRAIPDLYHNHHKTSSYQFFEGDLRATSASSPVSAIRQDYGDIPTAVNSSGPSSASISTSGSTIVHNGRSTTPSPKADDSILSNIFAARTISPVHRD
ncbi:inositol phosphorylceramide synthase [Sugiyamaella lignohabitans]|uniref:Inositol phosphorylceramide synthase n=1 Tax=Sugiyamaella lignohabitans TaxID=796027 RepID=A0A167E4M7_9ASCO|nr:inositol phosphorylceramide synthase [Sugiyamaella lignohabitans]ANB13631.1 inositol phosphorylceramide synthase [Sugiyamaella lignohabitans]